MEKGTAGYFWCLFAIVLCVNIPFIVCDFVFGSRDNACVTSQGESIGLTLGTWLDVEGAFRSVFCAVFLILAILGTVKMDYAMKMFLGVVCYMIVYNLFCFCWLIVGSVLFWGDLEKRGLCEGTEVQGYIYAVLIMGFLGCCSSSYSSYKQKNEAQ